MDNECVCWTDINGNSADNRLGHVSWVCIHAKCEDLLYTSTTISRTGFEQKRMLSQGYKLSEQKILNIPGQKVTHYSRSYKVFVANFQWYDTFLVKLLLI